MHQEELKARMKEMLHKECYINEHGLYYDDIYTDYRDTMDDETAKEILNSENPTQALTEKLCEWYDDSAYQTREDCIKKLREDPDLDAAYEKNEDLFREVLDEIYTVNYPYDRFLDQEVEIDIVLDTGNMNYDCVLDGFAHSYYGDREEEVDERSSLLWLCRQQGVSKEDLETALKTGECYPKDIAAVMERHASIHARLKELGMRADKPMDRYNQQGAMKKLLSAESVVKANERECNMLRKNLKETEMSYEEFCAEYTRRNRSGGRTITPPSKEWWSKRREEVLESNTTRLTTQEVKLDEAKKVLAAVMQEPDVAEVVKLREDLNKVNEVYIPMRQSEEYAKSRFLESVIEESANISSHMNTVTALVKMPLHQAIDLAEVIRSEAHLNGSSLPEERKGKSSITLSKDAVVGLYDPWNGAGGLFDIQLIKPLEIPVSLINDANVDGNRGYSVNEIYGGMEYTESLVEVNRAPEQTKMPLDQAIQAAQNVASAQLASQQNEQAIDQGNHERG